MKKEIEQMIIEVHEDKEKGSYLIMVSKLLMPNFQKAIIEGAKKENIIVFFHLKD